MPLVQHFAGRRTSTTITTALAGCALIALAACGGGSGSTPSVSATAAASATPSGPQAAGSIIISIGSAPGSTQAERRTLFVSPSATSIGIAVDGGTPAYSDVSSTSPNCTSSGATRTCTIPVSAPAGSATFAISLYSGAAGAGSLLGEGSGTANVTIGQPFSATIAVTPVVATLGAATITYASGTSFAPGTAGTATVAMTAADAGGNTIPAGATFAVPIALSSSDTHVSVSPASWTGTSQTITLTYDGSNAVASSVTIASSLGTRQLQTATIAISALNLYVAELGNSSLTVTAAGASGNTAPLRTISGANTQISNDYGLTIDASGNMYLSGLRNATITVYAAGASGNVAPTRSITGAATGLNYPLGLAIDGSGNLVVANFGNQSVTVYAPGASGNATPIRTISGSNTNLAEPYGIALDPAGNLYVVDNASQFGGTDELTVYAAGANGNIAPTRTITGAATGMSGAVYDAVDAAGKIYVTNATASSVTVYAAGANGNAAPVATISGSNTGISTPYGIVIDSAGNIYVGNGGTQTISVFAPGTNGNVAPIRTISGAATGISAPVQMLLAP